jgi:hypothetical protein
MYNIQEQIFHSYVTELCGRVLNIYTLNQDSPGLEMRSRN